MIAIASVATAPASAPASAQVQPGPLPNSQAPASPTPLDARALDMPQLLAGNTDISTAFSPGFLATIPIDQVRQIFASLRAQHGAPQRVARRNTAPGQSSGTVIVAYERADVAFDIAVDTRGQIVMLRITSAITRNDTIAALGAELAALPGQTAWGLYRIAPSGSATLLAGARHTDALAIGSSFKLAVLGTLDAEITAGRLHWADVVLIDAVSVPSGQLHNWPIGAPVTLHSLATLMISISDNSATDILVRHLGRERVEAFARAHGGLSGPNAFPMLTTIEATVLKNPSLGSIRTRWLAGDEASRRALLTSEAADLTRANGDASVFIGRVADIDRIEWFASPDSIAQLMGWFAHSASSDARAILAVNPGVGTSPAQHWQYIGFKGGSEPGVIAMNLLLRDPAGQDYAVIMAWNDGAAPVDDNRMITLMTRAVALLPQLAP